MIVIDTKKRQYLTSKGNALFSTKREFKKVSEGTKEGLPNKDDGESVLVAGVRLLSLWLRGLWGA